MKILLSTTTLQGYSLDRIFEVAKLAGFEGIDLKVESGNFDSYDAPYLKTLMERHQIKVFSIEAPDRYTENDVEKLVELAKKLETRVIVVSAPSLLSFSLTNWLKKEVPKIRRKENISIALENAKDETYLGVIPKHAMNNIYEMKKFKHASIDLSLLFERGSDIINTYNNLKDFLVHIHISNARRGKLYSDLKDGNLPIESLLSKLQTSDYLGGLSIKISPKEFELRSQDKVVQKLKEQIDFCKKYVQ